MGPDPLHMASNSRFTQTAVMTPSVHNFNVYHNMISIDLSKTADVSSARSKQMQGNEQSLPHIGYCLLYAANHLLIRYCRRHLSLKRIELNLCNNRQEQKI